MTTHTDVSRVHNRDASLKLFSENEVVYYEDFAGDYCIIKSVIEVSPFLEYVYRCVFPDGQVIHTTNAALRPHKER